MMHYFKDNSSLKSIRFSLKKNHAKCGNQRKRLKIDLLVAESASFSYLSSHHYRELFFQINLVIFYPLK
jgi:hypothetical protein